MQMGLIWIQSKLDPVGNASAKRPGVGCGYVVLSSKLNNYSTHMMSRLVFFTPSSLL